MSALGSKLRPAGLAVSGLLMIQLSGCALLDSEAGFPELVKKNFMASCKTNAAATSGLPEENFQEICACVLGQLENRFSLADFLTAEQDLLAGRPSDLDINALAAECL
jgi:hypothetical protein